jgi:hypothetical protein
MNTMSMSGTRTAVGRGGFTRNAGAAAGRGVLLIVFALAIGILLLARAIDGDDGTQVEAGARGSAASDQAEPSAPPTSSAPSTAAPAPETSAVPAAHEPAEVPVLVLNGREIQGVARANNDALLRLGYNGLAPANTSAAVATTAVYFTDPTFQGDALKVAEALSIPAGNVAALGSVDLGQDLKAAKVVVVLGQDGLGAKPS